MPKGARKSKLDAVKMIYFASLSPPSLARFIISMIKLHLSSTTVPIPSPVKIRIESGSLNTQFADDHFNFALFVQCDIILMLKISIWCDNFALKRVVTVSPHRLNGCKKRICTEHAHQVQQHWDMPFLRLRGRAETFHSKWYARWLLKWHVGWIAVTQTTAFLFTVTS